MPTIPLKLLVYQVKQFDGSYRFILAENENIAKKHIDKDERIVAREHLEQILGGEVEIICEGQK